jgi:STE24 endopeptidase
VEAGQEETLGNQDQIHKEPSPQREEGKAKEYQRKKLRLMLVSMVLDVVLVAVLLFSGLSIWLRDLVTGWTGFFPLQVLSFFVLLGAAAELISFPLDWQRGYRVEHQYELSNQTLAAWLWDWVKGVALSAVFGLLILELVYFLLREAGVHWWWIAALAMVFLMVVLAQLAPVLILPLFYKSKPLEREELKQRLFDLGERCEARIKDVFELEMSAKSKEANAALAGWGRTRRILLGDTMLSDYSDDEIEGVMAHELGHHHYGHIARNIVLQSAVIFVGFFLADLFLRQGSRLFGFNGPADLAAFPLLALAFTVLGLVLLPIVNGISRRYERQADDFAVRMSREPEALGSALKKLSRQNLADPDPHPLVEFLFYSHPPIKKRLAALETMLANRS